MKVTGIITEYNPFHNGHLYQIEQVKKNGADYVVIIMSGNFLQRGTPAILDKWTRTKMALSCNADLVIELPAVFATASAQYFARGGVSILDKLRCVDTLSFGCESDDLEIITHLSDLLRTEPEEYKNKLQDFLKEGYSFPKARVMALSSFCNEKEVEFLSSPNNILALEYCIALAERNSNIKILPIKRKGSGYHDTEVKTDGYASATAIRNLLKDTSAHYLKDMVPQSVLSIIMDNKDQFIWQNDFSLQLQYKLLSEQELSFFRYADVSEDLSDKICKNIRNYQNFTQFCELLKSKELTHARINRALTHILLNITQDMYNDIKKNDYSSYARVLGFRKESAPLLSEIGKKSSIPLITKLADAHTQLSEDDRKLLKHDIFCSSIYESIIANKTKTPSKNEYTQQLIIY